jgi:phosphoesterase RecJ-like protein
MTLDEILKEIKVAQNIVILTHESPDGDAIGSSLAMRLMLKELEKECDVIIPEYSRLFDFLPGIETIKKESQIKNYDLAIAVDCADIKRIAKKEYFENAKKTIVIDHHGSNNMFGDLNYVNPVSPACCEILAGIAEYFKMKITKELGTCIMTGIITDTGGFRHDGTNSETFEFAASLLKKGVNVSDIYKRVLQTTTKPCFELTRVALNRLEFFEEGKVAFTYITQADMQSVDAKTGDHEGIVEIGRNVEDVEVSVFAREIEDGWRLSLRSNQYINVSDVCIMFGGGGHPRAAGATITGNIEEVKEKILTQIKRYIRK